MATKTYNITFILVLILIIIILWAFMAVGQSYKYYNIQQNPIIEGATQLSTEVSNAPQKLLQESRMLQKHWGISFTVKLSGIPTYTGGGWPEIIAVSPDPNGSDQRFFGTWLFPNSTTLHIRTSTLSNWNDIISDCYEVPLEINKEYRIDVISTLSNNGDKQYIVAYITNKTNSGQPKLITNTTLSAPKYISSKGSNLGLLPGQIDTDKVYIFTSFNNHYQTFNGTLKDVVFVTGLKDPIVVSNLTDAINNARSNITSPFTTMDQAAIQEGLTNIGALTNIGSLGNNGGIKGYAPPTNTITNPTPATNYDPILVEDSTTSTNTRPVCTQSVIQTSDPSFNWISQYNYNYPLEFDSNGRVSKSVPICSPDDLYTIQTQILKELNIFNQEYSDYITYLYNQKHSAPGDTSPKLQYASGITDQSATTRYSKYKNVTDLPEYQALSKDLQTYNNLLKANKAYYPNPENPNDPKTNVEVIDPIILGHIHDEIVKKRNELDTKLFELNNVQNSAFGQSKMNMDSSIYVTLLWTTLATSIIYFMFV